MRDANTEKAREISKKCGMKYEDDQFRIVADSRPDCYATALEMAEAKDAALKQFLIEHISTDAVVETNENGEPLAESFIAAGEARLKAAEEVFNRYKQFEERML